VSPGTASPELWVGPEATINRVRNRYFNQFARSGHLMRLDDLDRLAGLGVRTLRYPVLWEQTCARADDEPEWGWADERMHGLRERGLRPILGLLHHGSGPPGTSLLDPAFPERLARYARRVAERYPWVEDWCPVNEVLTTARFSGLYGHWYPHRRWDDPAFITMVVNQARAIALAMREIRAVNPAARLVTTEDLQKVYTAEAEYEQIAWFQNERRWLAVDLLCGRVGPQHPLWGYLSRNGLAEGDLEPLTSNPCPPDLIGLNYYVCSERVLLRKPSGERTDREAVRYWLPGLAGWSLAREAWERFGLPIAITEVQLAGDEQDRALWFWKAWQAASALRAEDVDLRAVCAWAAFGAFDWNGLVTRAEGCYEAGVFTLVPEHGGSNQVRARGGFATPRPTLVAELVRTLAAGRVPDLPGLSASGWWERPDRLLPPLGQDARAVA
jgi:dTDP-4-dehydrorhamnose reductase